MVIGGHIRVGECELSTLSHMFFRSNLLPLRCCAAECRLHSRQRDLGMFAEGNYCVPVCSRHWRWHLPNQIFHQPAEAITAFRWAIFNWRLKVSKTCQSHILKNIHPLERESRDLLLISLILFILAYFSR